ASPVPRKAPEGPRSSTITELTGSELISNPSGRFLYSRRTFAKVASSGSVATSAQITTAIARDSSFQPRFWNNRSRIQWKGRITDAPARPAVCGWRQWLAGYRRQNPRSVERQAAAHRNAD